jgi:hypothetical protein
MRKFTVKNAKITKNHRFERAEDLGGGKEVPVQFYKQLHKAPRKNLLPVDVKPF